MADAIMAFSDMEMSAEQFVWDLLGLSPDDGKLVARIETKDKIELAKKFSERYRLPLHPNEQTSAEAWTAIRNAIEARNKMAHGVWMTIDLTTPIVVSYRIPIELGRINSEHFPRGGRLRRYSVSVPLSGSSAGWVHSVSLSGPHAGRALARPE